MFGALRKLLGLDRQQPDNFSQLSSQQQAAFKPVQPHDPATMAQNNAIAEAGKTLPQPDLSVAPANQWYTGPLHIGALASNPGGSYVTPFDNDAQADPFLVRPDLKHLVRRF